MSNQVHLITLGVKDMAVSRAYYEAMGWVAAPFSEDAVTFFQSGGHVLGLYLQVMLDHDTGLSDPRPGGITLSRNLNSRDEVDRMIEKALEAGASLLAAAKVMPWGGYVAYVADPDGHPWEFAYVEQLVPNADGELILPTSL